MKVLKIITVIVCAVFVCGAVAVWGLPPILSQIGLAYRNWLKVTLLCITLIFGLAFCVLLWVVFVKTILQKSRMGFRIAAGAGACLYTLLCFLVSGLLGIMILYFSGIDEWRTMDKYIVESNMGVSTRYLYINAFFRGSEGKIINFD